MTNYNAEIMMEDFIFDGRETLARHATKRWAYRDPSKLKGAVFHQSLEEYGTASGNAKYHVGPNHISAEGLPGLSYTLFVEKNGRAVLANGVECKTYSQGYHDPERVDENEIYIGICFGGNFSGPGYEGSQIPTRDQLSTAHKLWDHLKNIWGWRDQDLYGHYNFGKAVCPGDVLTRVIHEIQGEFFMSFAERQLALFKLGFYDGEIDGIWGPMSKAALAEFERSAGLVPDGVWDSNVNVAMKEALGV